MDWYSRFWPGPKSWVIRIELGGPSAPEIGIILVASMTVMLKKNLFNHIQATFLQVILRVLTFSRMILGDFQTLPPLPWDGPGLSIPRVTRSGSRWPMQQCIWRHKSLGWTQTAVARWNHRGLELVWCPTDGKLFCKTRELWLDTRNPWLFVIYSNRCWGKSWITTNWRLQIGTMMEAG